MTESLGFQIWGADLSSLRWSSEAADPPPFHLPQFRMGLSLLVGESEDPMSSESRRKEGDQMGPISEKIRRIRTGN